MTELVQGITVKIGGNERRVPPFRSYKVAVALDVLGGVTDQVRELLDHLAEERKKYAAANPVRISRQMCIERAGEAQASAEDFSKQASTETDPEKLEELEAAAKVMGSRAAMWERQLADMGDKEFTEHPGQMTQDQEVLIVLPLALKMRQQFIQLLGLAIMDDPELQDAWVKDTVLDVIEARGKDVLFEMEAGEEIEFLVAAREMFEAQLRPRKGALEKLQELRQWWSGSKKTEEKKDSEQEPEDDSSTDSSTSSQADTDGDQSESSLASSTT